MLAAHRSWLGRGIARARAVARAQELGAARKKQVLKIAEDLVAYTEEAEAALKLAQAGDFQQAWLEYRTLQRTRRSARAGMSVINILSQAVKVKQRAARNSDNAEVAEAAEKLIDLLEKKADLEVQLAEAQAVFERVAAEQRPRKKRRNKEREDNPQPQDVPPAIEAK